MKAVSGGDRRAMVVHARYHISGYEIERKKLERMGVSVIERGRSDPTYVSSYAAHAE
jgi:hypothetical protein